LSEGNYAINHHIHIHDELPLKIDKVAKEKGISRNCFVIQACEMALNSNVGTWPESFFRAELNQNDMRIRTKQSILFRLRKPRPVGVVRDDGSAGHFSFFRPE